MKSTLLYLFILLISFSASALDNIGRIRYASRSHAPVSRTEESETIYTSAIIEIDDDSAIEAIEAIGAKIMHRRNNFLLTYVPEDSLEALDRFHKVAGCSVSLPAEMCLDRAVVATNVDKILKSDGFPAGYTGKGVTVGFSDMGFDPGHAAFRGRVKKILHVVDTTATVICTTPEEWTTDNDDDFHATHVANILAGADGQSSYQGVARGADIVATTSLLDNVGILLGVEEIIAEAKAAGQPAVVNLSLGSTFGPHDGTDLFCRYLDECAEEAAIVLAAGNNGATRVYAGKTLTDDDNVISTMVESEYWNDPVYNNGYLDIWSSDGAPLKIRFRIWDRLVNDIVWESAWMDPSNQDMLVFDSETDEEFAKLFQGTILAAGEVSRTNGRYNIAVELDFFSNPYPGQSWARNNIVIDVEGQPSRHIDVYTKGSISLFTKLAVYPWLTSGTTDNSVSSIACGHNTVCVGSATTRDTAPLISGDECSWQSFVTAGTVSHYSSYGTTFDGRRLPHLCAPGAMIVSAFNRHELEKHPELLGTMSAESGEKSNYYFTECGTSMATPHVAGIFALWLEADPTLTGKELREIAVRTARHEGIDPTDPRSGAGMIDAAAGLRLILETQGIHEPEYDHISVYRDGDRLGIAGYIDDDLSVEVYTLAGVRVYCGSPYSAVLPNMPLIVRISNKKFCITRKLL